MNNTKTNFGKRKVNFSNKTPLVQEVFSDVANKYDLMNDLMSFGFHKLWKKRLVEIMNIQPDDKIVDVGAGTGDLAKFILKQKTGVNIYSIDMNTKMLNIAKKKFEKNNYKKIKFIKANAEKLPFNDNSFDKYVISFCLRNVTFIDKTLKEALRVLKPGGIFYCLEFSSPNTSIIKKLYSQYKRKVIPLIGEKVAKNKNAYKYLEESIESFYHQDILLEKIHEIGFDKIKYINLFNGIVCIHKGIKIL